MKYIKRISLIIVAVIVLSCSVPLSSMAVDPVSAATMANAFAQAITAYGASQGVSMTFDVANTDGIGEGVHDLWDQYASDMAQSNVTVSDYSNLAASVFPTLWKKTFDYVTVSLDSATVGEIDGFWNWLLSGPAEMTKVDNQYYEWNIDQNNIVNPIEVYFNGIFGASLPYQTWNNSPNASKFNACKLGWQSQTESYSFYTYSQNKESYVFLVLVSNSTTYDTYKVYYIASSYTENQGIRKYSGNNYQNAAGGDANNHGDVFYTTNPQDVAISHGSSFFIPTFSDLNSAISAFTNHSGDSINVEPYIGDEVPQKVYIPDNTDVNYTPVAAEIPLDILWDDSLFGDGTGSLTDAQSEAITQAADDAITNNPDKTLELADTANPPAPSPSEVYIPFLPVTLPSFQFSLSGIWHYVTAWVASLGAWFSLVFTTWSYLPYAISVPVYATAVIVIVLGVYKRFFM